MTSPHAGHDQTSQTHSFALDAAGQRAKWRGRHIPLGKRECLVVQSLVEAQGRVVSLDELVRQGWGVSSQANVLALRGVVRRLRRKFDDARLIETIGGEGYRLSAVGPPEAQYSVKETQDDR